MVGHGVIKDAHKLNSRYQKNQKTMQSMGKDQGVSKTEHEIESFVKSRQM